MSHNKEDIASKCPDYALIRDITNFKKHGNHDRNSRLRRTDDAIGEVVLITGYQDEAGEYSNSVKEFNVHLEDGTSQNLSKMLTNVVNFWCRYLAAKNVTPTFSEFPTPSNSEPLPREKCNSSLPGIVITRGLKFPGGTLLFQRYNYSAGRIEPMNLTGHTVTAKTYDPN